MRLQLLPRRRTVTGARPRVKPGATILVHAGLYQYNPEHCTGDIAIKAAKRDTHSVEPDYDVFVNVKRPGAKDLKSVQNVHKAEDLDFRLKAGSAAIRHGVSLPNITDGHAGAAPGLGALELGQAPPRYGPRP